MTLKQVVLPAPFGPIRPRISSSLRVKLTWFRAVTPPNFSTTSSTSSRARGADAPGPVAWASVRVASLNGGRLLLTIGELRRTPTVRQQALRSEDHHEDQDETEEHVAVIEGVVAQ